jgi:hypothetical protein
VLRCNPPTAHWCGSHTSITQRKKDMVANEGCHSDIPG